MRYLGAYPSEKDLIKKILPEVGIVVLSSVSVVPT